MDFYSPFWRWFRSTKTTFAYSSNSSNSFSGLGSWDEVFVCVLVSNGGSQEGSLSNFPLFNCSYLVDYFTRRECTVVYTEQFQPRESTSCYYVLGFCYSNRELRAIPIELWYFDSPIGLSDLNKTIGILDQYFYRTLTIGHYIYTYRLMILQPKPGQLFKPLIYW